MVEKAHLSVRIPKELMKDLNSSQDILFNSSWISSSSKSKSLISLTWLVKFNICCYAAYMANSSLLSDITYSHFAICFASF